MAMQKTGQPWNSNNSGDLTFPRLSYHLSVTSIARMSILESDQWWRRRKRIKNQVSEDIETKSNSKQGHMTIRKQQRAYGTSTMTSPI